MPRNFVNATLKESHYYANGTSGDDVNDGLTALTPKKTLEAVASLIPYAIKHNTTVHLSGEFVDFGYWGFGGRTVTNGSYFIVDGGTDVTQVAGPFTATASDPSKLYLEVSGAGWTSDEYAGYWIEITSGSQASTQLTIRENTAERIYVCKAFAADPGLCDFRIVRPSTALVADASNISVVFNNWFTDGWVVVQNIFLSSLSSSRYAYLGFYYSKGRFGCSSVVTNVVDSAKNSVTLHNLDYAFFSDNYYDPDTFAVTSGTGKGFSARGGGVSISASNTAVVRSGYFSKCLIGSTGIGGPIAGSGIYGGVRFKELVLIGNKMDPSAVVSDHMVNTGGYAPTTVSGASGVGLLVDKSYFKIGSGVTIADNVSHGVEVKNHSNLILDGAVTGSGNGGVGLYAHSGSQVQISGSSPPTVTGSDGNVAVSKEDLVVPDTWADVIANGGSVCADEATLIEVL